MQARRGNGPPSAEALRTAHRDEAPHSDHVASLAMRLFDGVARRLKLPAADRPLLRAAALLHDIGFDRDPATHARIGAALVETRGLAGFTPEECRDIEDAIRLHGGAITSARVRNATARARRIAAILRVADGLDHSHLQDARIVRIDTRTHPILIRVSAGVPEAIHAGLRKADLWKREFGYEPYFQIIPRAGFERISPTDDAWSGLRRLLLVRHRALEDALHRTKSSDEADPLHDIRLSVRGLRRLLDAFEKSLRPMSIRRVQRGLRTLGKQMGPARDGDVWMALLARPWAAAALKGVPGAREFLAAERRAWRLTRKHAVGTVRRPSAERLLDNLARLARVDLLHRAPADRSLRDLAVRRLRRAWKNARALSHLARSEEGEDLHDLRIELRRFRVLVDELRDALPVRWIRAGRLARAADRVLGRIHDLDLAYERLEDRKERAAEVLRRELKQRRNRRLDEFRARWKAWRDYTP